MPEKNSEGIPKCQHGNGGEPYAPDLNLIDRAARILRVLGDPARLRTVDRLARGEACVSELAEESGENLSTVSQRLRLLRAERIVVRRRDGKHIYYSLIDDHVLDVVKAAFDHAGEEP